MHKIFCQTYNIRNKNYSPTFTLTVNMEHFVLLKSIYMYIVEQKTKHYCVCLLSFLKKINIREI